MIRTEYIGYTLVPSWTVNLLTAVLVLGVILVIVLLINEK